MPSLIECLSIHAIDPEDAAVIEYAVNARGDRNPAAALEELLASLQADRQAVLAQVAERVSSEAGAPEAQFYLQEDGTVTDRPDPRTARRMFGSVEELQNALGPDVDVSEQASSGERILYQGGEVDPRTLEANFAELESRTFATGRKLKLWLQEKALQKQQEDGIDLTTRILAETPQETIDAIVDAVVPVLEADARYALQDNRGAIGWYNRTVSRALQIAGAVYPEINTDANARMRFMWALAVTSNGIKVDKNFDYAGQAYEGLKQTGRFPEIKAGQASEGINFSLQLYHTLSEAWGDDLLRQFMMTDWTVSEIKKLTGIEVSGENASTVVRGAAVLGAKIGNGFYANLNGHFDALTIDRWNMRTIGRIRGTLIESRPDMVASVGAELQGHIDGLTPEQLTHLKGFFNGKSSIDPGLIGPNMSEQDLANLATEIKKRSAAESWRDHIAKAKGRKWPGDEIRKAGNKLWGWIDGQVEIANNGTEREMIRQAHKRVLDNMVADDALDVRNLTMSDLQALLWYPEKRLYDAAKAEEGAERGYQDDEAPDYANAARKWAERRGVSIPAEPAGGADAGLLGAEGGLEGGIDGFTPEQRRDFQRRAGISSLVRGGDPAAPRAVSGLVSRKSLEDGRGVRGLAVKQKLTAPKNKRFGKWMAEMGVALPPLYELDAAAEAQTFADAITLAKEAAEFGAAVYVYPTEEYADMRLYMTEDGGAGFAVKPDGDIVSVFSSTHKGSVDWLMQAAIDQGGRKLDAFDTVLPGIYARSGFKVVQRLQWDDQYMPSGWDKDLFSEFNGGEPDVVLMEFDETYFGHGDELQVGPTELFQDDTGPRGSIQLPSGGILNGETVINLFESSNLSTFFHEIGHLSLEAMMALSQEQGAPQQLVEDMATIRAYLGMNEKQKKPTTEQHEVWARSFEAYLMEGKSPSLELTSAFQRTKMWFLNIYKNVRNLRVNLTPDVREVMDRLLATEDQIAEAQEEARQSPLFTDGFPPGMPASEAAAYQKLAQRRQAEASRGLMGRMMEKVRRKTEAWYKSEAKAAREMVEKDIAQQPVYQAIEALGNGSDQDGEKLDIRLSKADIESLYGDRAQDVLNDLKQHQHGNRRHMYGEGENAISVAEAADLFGYRDPAQLIDDLRAAPAMKDAIEAEVNRIMDETHGDVLSDGSIEEAALAEIHNDQAGQMMVAELRVLAKKSGRPDRQLRNRIMKARAETMLGQMQERKVRPEQFLKAERKAAAEAEKAWRQVDTGNNPAQALAAAYQAKEQQVLSHYQYMAARDWRKKMDRMREKMRDYERASVQEKIGSPEINQILGILADYEFRKRTQSALERQESLKEYVDQMIEAGRQDELAIDGRLLEEARRQHYSRMKVEDLNGLFDTVLNLEHLGRFKNDLRTKQRNRKLAASAETVADQIRKHLKARRPSENPRRFDQFIHLFRDPDTIAIRLDGGEEFGPVYDELLREINEGDIRADARMEEAADEVNAIYREHYTVKEIREFGKEVAIPGAGTWTKEEILALAMNMGSESNFQRIMDDRVDPRQKMTPERLHALLSTLDARDWRFAQDMINKINSYWPELSDVKKRETGVEPQKVEAKVMYDGAPDFFVGGYYPLKYNPKIGGKRAQQFAEVTEQRQRSQGMGTGQVKNGMTHQREASAGGQTVLLSLMVPVGHIRDTIRYIELREAVSATQKILNHEEVIRAFQDADSMATKDALQLVVDAVATGPKFNQDWLNSMFRAAKVNFSLSKLGLNLKTIILQVTGLPQSSILVGHGNMIKAMAHYFQSPMRMSRLAEEVREKSSVMNRRSKTFQKDLYDIRNQIALRSPVKGRLESAQEWMANAGMAPITWLQFWVVDMPTWLAAYSKMQKEGKSEADAIHFADRLVERAQDSGRAPTRSMIELGSLSKDFQQSDIVRGFTTLGGYMYNKMNRAQVEVIKTVFKIKSNDPIQVKLQAALIATGNLFIMYFAEAAMMAAIYASMSDEDDPAEDIPPFLGKEAFGAVSGGVPLMRDVYGKSQGFDAGLYGSVIGDIADIITQTKQGEIDPAFVRAWLNGIGDMTGLPTVAAGRVISFLMEPDDYEPAEMLMGRNPLTR